MLFNSFDFALFLPIVFILYWFAFNRNLKAQNWLVVAASYFFYSSWDWRFLFLIAFSSLVDYYVGLGLKDQGNQRKRKTLLVTSIVINLGLLGFFKYYNFFLDNFIEVFSLMGYRFEARSLNIILPVGISFYTFQTMSYTIDVYRRKLQPTTDIAAFLAFVSFFPQLVAGPIERATHLLPQFRVKRIFDHAKAVDGLRQILWGLFKKIVIADNCAEYANHIFDHYTTYNGSILLLGAMFFAIQIYGDFSGYSDIAIGTARLFGISLMKNFAFPYFSRNMAEFWRRWHISLTTWFRDYLYIPLGGSRGSNFQKVRNIFVIFIVSGFWHGANWTFIIWGCLHALYFLPLVLLNRNRVHLDNVAHGRWFPSIKESGQMGLTFLLTCLAWIFFRAENMEQAFGIFANMVHGFFTLETLRIAGFYLYAKVGWMCLVLGFFIVMEWLGREKEYAIENVGRIRNRMARWILYYIIVMLIFSFAGKGQHFIYFQF
jgi:D-alanyl-lipoteichoic acid acyltransferase DltB (MBOAT superfamily)